MAVQFILGRAGCGKSKYCLDKIADDLVGGGENPIILLLPEQATYQSERAILSNKSIKGYSRLHVLSFNRLDFRLAQLSGRNTGGVELSKLGCEMVIRKILSGHQGGLSAFARSYDKQGTARQLASTISRLFECEIGVDEVKGAAANLMKGNKAVAAASKLADIGFVYEKYLEFFEEMGPGTINPDVRLSQAKADVCKADFLKNANVYVDGFASFTQQEIEMLMEVIKVSASTSIVMCLDPTKVELVNPDKRMLSSVSMFYSTEKTYVELTEAIRASKVKIASPVLLNKVYRFDNTALEQVEKYCFDSEGLAAPNKKTPSPLSEKEYQQNDTTTPLPTAKGCHPKQDTGFLQSTPNTFISIVSAANPRAEIDAVARKIIDLVKNRGYRFKDIAIIMSHPEEYRHYILSAFADHGIACFIDVPGAMNNHPAAELITAALRVVCGSVKTSDVIAYLKTDLGPIERDQADVLENYCIAYGIDGTDWGAKDKWEFADKKSGYNEEKIDKLRKEIFKPLAKLNAKLNGSISASEFTKAVFEFFEELKIREKLAEWEATDPSGIHQQFYNKLVDVFDEMVRVLGEEQAEVSEFAMLLGEALGEMKLKLIPQTLDQVLVGSIERSRHPELKAMFLVGANQKHFPASIASSNILTEEDKKIASGEGLELGDSLLEQLAGRQYLAYIAFTRASEYLHISYSTSDSGGKSHTLSGFVSEMARLFDGLKIEKVQAKHYSSKGVLADDLCKTLGVDSGTKKEEAINIAEKLKGEQIEAGNVLAAAIGYDNEAVVDKQKLADFDTEMVKDGQLLCSTSRLTSFAECPYKHFARYMLQLKERDMMKLEIMDMGSFYHKVLEGVSKDLINDKLGFGDAENEKLEEFCKKQIADILENDALIGGFVKRSAFNNYVITSAFDVITEAVKGYAKASRAGAFKLSETEAEFGFESSKAECKFVLNDKTEVVLRGVIDRLDTAKIDGKLVGLIFDYKLNKRMISYNKLGNRLDMQLPIYMLAVKSVMVNCEKIDDVAGAFYLPVQVKVQDGDPETFDKNEKKFEYKAYGIFDGDYAECLEKDANQWSNYYNFYVSKKDGPFGFFGNSGAVNKKQLEKILEFTQNSIVELAEKIVEGNISVTPYRIKGASPCTWCEMRSVCRFDWQVNKYNILESFDKKSWLNYIGAGDE